MSQYKKIIYLIFLLVCMSSCSSKVDFTKYVDVSFEGTNQKGAIHTSINKERLIRDMYGYSSIENLSKSERNELNKTLGSIKIKWSKFNNLSNGEVVTMTIEKKNSINKKNTSTRDFKVKGLKEKNQKITKGNSEYTVSYGEDQANKIDIKTTNHNENDSVIVLIHGGYWRSEYTLDLMKPLADYFENNGFTVANIEYRIGNDKWPTPYNDARNAINLVKENFKNKKIVLIGHSVGGQLALLNGDLADKVVALAPVTNLIDTKEYGLGNNAVSEYFGENVSQEELKSASPFFNEYNCKKLLIVHGLNDDAVKIENSVSYFEKNKQKTNSIDFFAASDLQHMECIDPSNPYIKVVQDWIEYN